MYVPNPNHPVVFATTASWIVSPWIVQWTAIPSVGSLNAGRKVFRAYCEAVALASHAVYSVSALLVLPKYVAAEALAALAPFVQKRENATKSDVIFIAICFMGVLMHQIANSLPQLSKISF
jgi:hypothetical protein